MDAGVYDHIQEKALDDEQRGKGRSNSIEEPGSLATDLQDTYKSFTASPWGAKLGGLWGTVNKQAQTYYQEATKEAGVARDEAFKGFTALKTTLEGRARSLSSGTEVPDTAEKEGSKAVEGEKSGAEEPGSPAFIERFRSEAAKRLQDLHKAEDAADEALLKFGTNIRNFLRDAVTVTPPSDELAAAGKGAVLFESKDAEGKRVIHTSRFDAQLHVIHCSLDSFTKDPVSPEYQKWADDFNIVNKTDEITVDLKKYDELRKAMETLVPEKVDYLSFWRRYYFLRMVIDSEEKRRKEMLQEAANNPDDTEVAWDSEEEGGPSTPQPRASTEQGAVLTPLASSSNQLKEPRKSHDEKSTAGSESSYDLVSGATSAAPGSPQEKKDEKKSGSKKEDSDDDWE